MIPFPKRKIRHLKGEEKWQREAALAEKLLHMAHEMADKILDPITRAHVRQEIASLGKAKEVALAEVGLGLARYALALEETALEWAKAHGHEPLVAFEALRYRLGAPALAYFQKFGGPKDSALALEEARKTAQLYFPHDFRDAERRLRLARAGKGLQAKVVKRRCQERENRPAYPVVRVWDEAGSLEVEVFLGGFSMGNAVSRLLSEPPTSWSEDRLEAARRLAVRKALEEC